MQEGQFRRTEQWQCFSFLSISWVGPVGLYTRTPVWVGSFQPFVPPQSGLVCRHLPSLWPSCARSTLDHCQLSSCPPPILRFLPHLSLSFLVLLLTPPFFHSTWPDRHYLCFGVFCCPIFCPRFIAVSCTEIGWKHSSRPLGVSYLPWSQTCCWGFVCAWDFGGLGLLSHRPPHGSGWWFLPCGGGERSEVWAGL